MSLKTVPLKAVYRTATDSLVKDFYLPCLAQAVHYDRAVGFFSSSMLVEAGVGLSGLIRNNGRMRLLIGHPLSDDDWDAIQAGTKLETISQQLVSQLADCLERAGNERSVHAYELLSWMVATGAIEIRFAFRKVGMYHEKIGIIHDKDANSVVFSGSANESANALLPTRNFESLTVYPSWNAAVYPEYGKPFAEGFLALWNNQTDGICTVPVPSMFYEQLMRFRGDQPTAPDLTTEQALWSHDFFDNLQPLRPTLPKTLNGAAYALKPHQQRALLDWAANAYSGILALATGAGKTITALHAATRFCEQDHPIVLVIAVPYQILAEQWCDVMAQFGMRPVPAFYSRDRWMNRLDDGISAFLAGATRFLSVVVVNDTLSTPDFQRRLERIPSEQLFFVGDECHHHAGQQWLTRVPVRAKFRLGMSATPWEPGRDSAKQTLTQMYGTVVATYSLRDALADKVLCPYSYRWVPCEFDDDEAQEYEALSVRIASLMAQDPHGESESIRQQIQTAVARRSRLIGALRDKETQLTRIMEEIRVSPHTLFYCGEGEHPLDRDAGTGDKVISGTLKRLAARDWKVGKITASEGVAERHRTLQAFDDGWIDAIAAIRVLDEGFDIPSCRTAYILASSNSYRQYVQRRGRVLRRSPGKHRAEIIDFAAVPSLAWLGRNPTIWRRQMSNELNRIRDFVALASNAAEQQYAINAKMEQLGLGGIYYEQAPLSEENDYAD